jgi:adenine-specific DNA-methyltransferase
VDFADPYLSDQLIAYIGNKRALLPFLHGVFSSFSLDPRRGTFLDPFAGSGAVSRLARAMGFHVAANDWEPYSFVINTCHLRLSPSDLDLLFQPRGGIEAALADLNALPPLPESNAYISRHYAPKDTDHADWSTERLFYTRENALIIDAVRQRIEDLYPGMPGPGETGAALQKAALLAPLLYEAATHTNTSGVFKAFHRGFGGHGRDALRRILGPIRLARPVLCDSRLPAEVACMDAAAFLSGRTAEICYLDPPYAVHQYGSNYFMLNTIALWDRLPVSQDRDADGRLTHKAGIRPDWTRTRSAFCYRDTAAAAMKGVVDAADCRWLVVSYSNEGLIELEELCDLLAATGELAVLSKGYAKYPGGKQSLHRTTRNMELALVVRRGGQPRSTAVTQRALLDLRIARLFVLSYDPARIRAAFPIEGDAVVVRTEPAVLLQMRHFWRFEPDQPLPRFTAPQRAEAFIRTLSACAVLDIGEEIRVCAALAADRGDGREKERILRETLRLLNKLAHRKYRNEFEAAVSMLRAAATTRVNASPAFLAGLDRVEEKARKRGGGVFGPKPLQR